DPSAHEGLASHRGYGGDCRTLRSECTESSRAGFRVILRGVAWETSGHLTQEGPNEAHESQSGHLRARCDPFAHHVFEIEHTVELVRGIPKGEENPLPVDGKGEVEG